MTDNDILLAYRIRQADEALADARTLLESRGLRAAINRAYYAAFYGALALFLKAGTDVRTSKHAGIIALFNKEFVHAGRIDVEYSRLLQRRFNPHRIGLQGVRSADRRGSQSLADYG